MPKQTPNYTKEQRQLYLDLYEKGDMNQKEFCEHNNLNRGTFNVWIKRGLRSAEENPISILPVDSAFVDSVISSNTIRFPCGIKLIFTSDSDVKLIAQLITKYKKCN